MKQWLIRIGVVVVLGAVFHVLTVMVYPSAILFGLSMKHRKAGRVVNTMYHAPRVTAMSKDVVRPSPDLLYSVCSYDVSEAPLSIAAPIPDSYWSLSFFAANTDNFFVINDRQVESDRIDVLLVGPNGPAPEPGNAKVVVSPSEQGVALLRTLITDEGDLDALVRIQRQASCESLLHPKN